MEGHIVLWAKSAWDTKAKVSPADYSAYRSQFIFDVQTVIEMEKIPKELGIIQE